MTAQLPAALAGRLAASATGYGAVIDGVLNIRTVTDTANHAAINALFLCGVFVQSTCGDPECDCMVRLLARLRPGDRIVPVAVEVTR